MKEIKPFEILTEYSIERLKIILDYAEQNAQDQLDVNPELLDFIIETKKWLTNINN